MAHIYKVAHVVNNEIIKIVVFFGASESSLYKNDPDNILFNGLFSPEEKDTIREKSTPVLFVDDYIHLDDTVETIKKKIIVHIPDLNASYDELYLFAKKYESFNSIHTYQTLTQNEKINLTKDRLKQFLLNINDLSMDAIGAISDKDNYTYEDILLLGLDDKRFLINIPIGQTFVAIHSEFPYTVDPFDVLVYDAFLEQFADEITTTTNQAILMNSIPIYHNMIYCCTAENVLKYATDQKIPIESTIKIYFPNLFKKSITSETLLQEHKQELLVESEAMVSNAFKRNNNNVNMFYQVYYQRRAELPYAEKGIKEIEFTIHPNYSFNLPLDVVFKLIHATINVPFIKYNPSNRQEKIYRLYADRVATNGKKIPYLNKATIFKLIKNIGITKSVAVYIDHFIGSSSSSSSSSSTNSTPIPVVCEFETNGDITIKSVFNTGFSIADINKEVALAVNPIIDVVKDFLAQSGYSMNNFSELGAPTIEILNMEYSIYVPITKPIKLKKMIGCLSSLFNVVTDDIDVETGAVMRLKRVANYNEMDSQDAFIVELLKTKRDVNDIVKEFSVNFQVTEAAAKAKLQEFASSTELIQSTFQSKKLKIKNNPGFLTTMKKDRDNVLNITITGLNDIHYLETLPIYIDSIIRITQDPTSSSVLPKTINALCNGEKIQEDIHVKDISAPLKALVKQQQAEEQEREEQPQAGQLEQAEEQLEQPKEERVYAQHVTFDETETETVTDNTMMDLLFGFGSDEEQEQEQEEQEQEEQSGGVSPEAVLTTDLVGKKLSNPTPFFQKLKTLEPDLIITEPEGKYKSYAVTCPSTNRRQPVILTQAEKERIDRLHPGSYDQAIEYGSDPKKKNWYICPRYWSLKDNTSLTAAEVKDTDKYGQIIPSHIGKKKVTTIPGTKPGQKPYTIYEFDEEVFHRNSDGSYKNLKPGFLDLKQHPDGKCIPCCFTDTDTPKQKELNKKCTSSEPVKTTPLKTDTVDNYILGAEKFPLDQNRYGYLPLPIQNFIQTDNKKCQVSSSNTNLKPNYPCFVRHGVEASKTQSFIACIADIWVDIAGGQVLSIKEMKEVLINALSPELFATLQNGDLTNIFSPQQQMELPLMNFINYLRDDTVVIDHTYLWDLICGANPKLFPQGSNLVILEIKNNDITANVQLICPTNHYSAHLFDSNKKTIILIKSEDYYEPMYIFEDKVDQFIATRRFNLNNKDLLPNIRKTLELIKKTTNTKCIPFPSMPNIYKFKQNILLGQLVDYLLELNYTIQTHVMNYNGKVVGVTASKNGVSGYIPCFPTGAPPPVALAPNPRGKELAGNLPRAEIQWMDDITNYPNDYNATKDFLTTVYKESKGKIPCKPVVKVMEDGLIIGILTQTNQLVLLAAPAEDIYDDELEKMTDTNADKMAITDTTIDTQRVDYIRRIKLESSFYNVFRNTMRFLIGEFRYRHIRADIEKIITSSTIVYTDKLKQVDQLLRELMKNHISFSIYSPELLAELGTITNCYMAKNQCKGKEEGGFCLTKETDDGITCALVIPENNLISEKNNEELYFGRMADELIRYSRIRSFIFQPKSFLAFSAIKYNLKEDEIILLESLLTQAYFADLIPIPVNKYITYNTFDTAKPFKTQPYNNEVDMESTVAAVAAVAPTMAIAATTAEPEKNCDITKGPKVVGAWANVLFTSKSSELAFSTEPELCSFDVILTCINDNNKNVAEAQAPAPAQPLTKYKLKEIVAAEYIKLQATYNFELLQILSSQGKSAMVKLISSRKSTLDKIVMSYNYYATNLDIWILAVYFNIPLVFISASTLIENGLTYLLAHDDGSDAFYFIKSPAVKTNKAPAYKLVVGPTGEYKIPLENVKVKLQKYVKENTIGDTALIDYIKNFSKEDTDRRIKGQNVKLNTKLKLVI